MVVRGVSLLGRLGRSRLFLMGHAAVLLRISLGDGVRSLGPSFLGAATSVGEAPCQPTAYIDHGSTQSTIQRGDINIDN